MDILIVKMSSLGDLIHAFPILEYLRQIVPAARIDWVVEESFSELVRAHPLVHEVLTVKTKKWRSQFFSKESWNEIKAFRRSLRKKKYDLVLDLQGNIKSACVTAAAKSSMKIGFAFATAAEWPNVLTTHKRFNPPPGGNIRDDYLFLVQSAFGDFCKVENQGVRLKLSSQEESKFQEMQERFRLIDRPKIMVCPGSNWPNKQLSEETLRSFLELSAAEWNAHFIFVWGNQAEKEMAERLSLSFEGCSTVLERVSLPLLQNFMSCVVLVIAMDSLPLHLAGVANTSTFSIFGPSSASKYAPAGVRHATFQGTCPYGKTFNKRCALLRSCKTGACMKELSGSLLFKYLAESRKHLQ